MMSKTLKALLLMFGLGLLATASALPLWLDAPSRSNKFDPKSGLAALPTNTAVVTSPTVTKTNSPSPTITATASPTFSISPTPSFTNTALGTFTDTPTSSPTFTNSPTMTVSPTLAPPTDTFTDSPTPTPTITNTPCSSGITGIYEDFEAANLFTSSWSGWDLYGACSGYTGGVGASVVDTFGSEGTDVHSCATAWQVTLQYQGCDSYPPYFGLASSSLTGTTGDFTGATKFSMWIKSDKTLVFDVYVQESTTAGADGDSWQTSTPVTVAGDNAWHNVVVPFSSMTGGTTFDTQSLAFPWFFLTDQWSGGQLVDPPATILIDDIAFIP